MATSRNDPNARNKARVKMYNNKVVKACKLFRHKKSAIIVAKYEDGPLAFDPQGNVVLFKQLPFSD